jgi:ketosteroid isomerase-like protein
MTHGETLGRFFPAMFEDDEATLRELLAENVIWRVPPFTFERFGDLFGREAVLGFLCGVGDEFYQPGSFKIEVDIQAVQGDQGIVMGRISAVTAAGKPYSNRYAFGFRFEAGRIAEAWELLESVHFEAQMGAG